MGTSLTPAAARRLGDAGPFVGGWAALGEVVEEGEGVRLATAELGGEIEDRAGLGALTGEAADGLAGKGGQVPGQVGPGKEPVRPLVVGQSGVVAHVVQVDGELRSVEGFAFAEVLAGCDDSIPRFEGHISALLKMQNERILT